MHPMNPYEIHIHPSMLKVRLNKETSKRLSIWKQQASLLLNGQPPEFRSENQELSKSQICFKLFCLFFVCLCVSQLWNCRCLAQSCIWSPCLRFFRSWTSSMSTPALQFEHVWIIWQSNAARHSSACRSQRLTSQGHCIAVLNSSDGTSAQCLSASAVFKHVNQIESVSLVKRKKS